MSASADLEVDAACIGETMVLLVPDPPMPPEDAATFRRDIGGAESNVAIHLARAGLGVAWHSALGEDPFGSYVRHRICAEGVVCAARIDDRRPTGLYFKELGPHGTRVRYYRAGSAASALTVADAAAVWRRKPRLVHTTGITAALSDASHALVCELLTTGPPDALRSFDVNYRPSLHDRAEHADDLGRLAREADVVFCGLDEAQALWGCRTVDDVADLLAGPDLVVVKQGSEGATLVRGSQQWFEPAPQVNVVEPTGAGDAFAAGFLAAKLGDAVPQVCLAEAARLAGDVLQVRGDIPEARGRAAGSDDPASDTRADRCSNPPPDRGE